MKWRRFPISAWWLVLGGFATYVVASVVLSVPANDDVRSAALLATILAGWFVVAGVVVLLVRLFRRLDQEPPLPPKGPSATTLWQTPSTELKEGESDRDALEQWRNRRYRR